MLSAIAALCTCRVIHTSKDSATQDLGLFMGKCVQRVGVAISQLQYAYDPASVSVMQPTTLQLSQRHDRFRWTLNTLGTSQVSGV